jgi:hypothetical protein
MTPNTYVLTNNTFIITASMGIKNMSCVLVSGAATFLGQGNGFAGTPLTSTTAFNTITASAGVVNILVSLS